MAVTDAFRFLQAPALSSRFSLDELLERWREALLRCLPSSLRRRLLGRDSSLVVIPLGAAAGIVQQQGAERRAIAEVEASDASALKALLAGVRGRQPRTIVELPDPQVLVRSVSFPVQVRNNLSRVMRYEIDRVSPFQVDQVYFDFRLRDVAAPGDKLLVELVLCRRDLAQDWVQRLREAGAPAERLTWASAWPRANLLPPEERPQRQGGAFGAIRLMLLVAALLLTAVLVTPLWQKSQVLDALAADLREAKAKAEEVQQVRVALDRAREGSVAVLQRKLEQPLMVDLLRELTERLPDDTWVQNLDVREGEVQIRGESARATALIGLLEQAPGISEVTFRSPVVQDSASGQERFHISFKYVRQAPQ